MRGNQARTGLRDGINLLPVSILISKTHCPTEKMKKVVIHSDGGCHGNPGPGGWAAVLEHGQHKRELSGGDPASASGAPDRVVPLARLEPLLTRLNLQLRQPGSLLSLLADWDNNFQTLAILCETAA